MKDKKHEIGPINVKTSLLYILAFPASKGASKTGLRIMTG